MADTQKGDSALSPQRLFSIPEACEYLRVSRRTVYRLMDSGDLRATRMRSRVFFGESELARLTAYGTRSAQRAA